MPIINSQDSYIYSLNKYSYIKFSFIFLAFLGSFLTYPKASPVRVMGLNENQIIIYNAEDFIGIDNDLEATYTLANNIDLNGQSLKPFGIEENSSFKGVFDGNGYKVTNFILQNHESNIGLFYLNEGLIKNTTFEPIGFNISMNFKSNFDQPIYQDSIGIIATKNLKLGTIQNVKVIQNDDLIVSPSDQDLILMNQYLLSIGGIVNENFGLIQDVQMAFSGDWTIEPLFQQVDFHFVFGGVAAINHSEAIIQDVKINNYLSLDLVVLDASKFDFASIAYQNHGTISNVFLRDRYQIHADFHNSSNTQISHGVSENYSFFDQSMIDAQTTTTILFKELLNHEFVYGGIAAHNFENGTIQNILLEKQGTLRLGDVLQPKEFDLNLLLGGALGRNEGQVDRILMNTQIVNKLALIRTIDMSLKQRIGGFLASSEAENFGQVYVQSADEFSLISTVDSLPFINDLLIDVVGLDDEGDGYTPNDFFFHDSSFYLYRKQFVSTVDVEELITPPAADYNLVNSSDLVQSFFTSELLLSSIVWNFNERSKTLLPTLKSYDSYFVGLSHLAIYSLNHSFETSASGYKLNGLIIDEGEHFLFHAGNFVLSYDDDFVFKQITFAVREQISQLVDGATYAGEVTPTITGAVSMTLNGNAYTSGTRINTPGSYSLIVIGVNDYQQTYTFFVDLVITGVSHQSIYTNAALTIGFSGGSATLNGDPFTSGSIVNDVGHYEFIVLGVNDFMQTLTFTNRPDVQNLIDGTTYEGSVLPSISGSNITITLNGESYTNGITINNPGFNQLIIQSSIGDYSMVIDFDIQLLINIVNSTIYHNIVTPQFSGGIASLNGESFVSNSSILTFGSFTLTVRGYRNDFEATYQFNISPFTIDLPQLNSIHETFQLEISSLHDLTEVFHNGQKTIESINIYLIGYHFVKVYFAGTLIEDISFTIEPTYFLNETTFYEPLMFPQLPALVKINQLEMNADVRIDASGSYFVQVYGVNDYYHELTFHVVNVIEDISLLSVVPISVAGVIPLLSWLLRKRFVK